MVETFLTGVIIDKFKLEMIKLNIYSDYFKDLMNYVKEKLSKY